MIKRNQRQWERLGRTDPYWAVLTRPDEINDGWNRQVFFDSGRREIAEVMSQLKKLNCLPDRQRSALDFGCGVGRLSRALAGQFEKVLAVDVARSMLQEARAANRQWNNIKFIHNPSSSLDFIDSGSIDFVYSNITLQHIPAADQLRYVEEFCRILSPGGALVFQTPSAYSRTLAGQVSRALGNRLMNLLRAVRYGPDRVMEMHILPRARVESILQSRGLYLALAQRYDAAGTAFISFRYFARFKEHCS